MKSVCDQPCGRMPSNDGFTKTHSLGVEKKEDSSPFSAI